MKQVDKRYFPHIDNDGNSGGYREISRGDGSGESTGCGFPDGGGDGSTGIDETCEGLGLISNSIDEFAVDTD